MTYISPARRHKSATVHVGKKEKFPVDSVQTAKSAIKLIHRAKPALTPGQEATVRSKAAKFGVKSKTADPDGSAGKSESKKKKAG